MVFNCPLLIVYFFCIFKWQLVVVCCIINNLAPRTSLQDGEFWLPVCFVLLLLLLLYALFCTVSWFIFLFGAKTQQTVHVNKLHYHWAQFIVIEFPSKWYVTYFSPTRRSNQMLKMFDKWIKQWKIGPFPSSSKKIWFNHLLRRAVLRYGMACVIVTMSFVPVN